MKKQIIICDGCEKELKKTSDIYHLNLETDRFWDGIENSSCVECLDFCQHCSVYIKESLISIAHKLKKNN